MKIRLIWVGKTKELWCKEAIDEYIARLKYYVTFEVVEIKEHKENSKEALLKQSELIEKQIKPNSQVFLFDEIGSQYSSVEFSKLLDKYKNESTDITFVIGGAYGYSEELKNKYKKISLSKMTFTHQLVRLFVVEQIYRGFTIIAGEPYHH